MKSKKILFDLFRFPEFGGISTVTSILLPELLKLGYEVDIVSHREPNKEYDGPESVNIYYTPDFNDLTSRPNYEFYDDLLKRNRYDIIVYQDNYSPTHRMICQLAEKYGATLLVCEHNAPTNVPHSRTLRPFFSVKGFLRRVLHPLFVKREVDRKRYILDHCSRYILLSEAYIKEFADYVGLTDTSKLAAINNPILTVPDLDLDKKIDEVLFVGRIVEEKGLGKMIRLWEEMALDGVQFKIVGDGPKKAEYQRQVESRGIKGITFEGYRDPTPYFKESKIFWMNSKFEGWPMTLIEAMSNGCVPIVTNSFAAVYDIIEDGVDGFIVEHGDNAAIKERTRRLLDDTALYRRMAANAQAKSKHFSIDKIIARWADMLKAVD